LVWVTDVALQTLNPYCTFRSFEWIVS